MNDSLSPCFRIGSHLLMELDFHLSAVKPNWAAELRAKGQWSSKFYLFVSDLEGSKWLFYFMINSSFLFKTVLVEYFDTNHDCPSPRRKRMKDTNYRLNRSLWDLHFKNASWCPHTWNPHIWEGSGIEGWLWLHSEWMGTPGYPRPFTQ